MSESLHQGSVNKEQREFPPVLHEVDAYIIERGMGRLYDYLENTPSQDFPDLIVFPDVSARPLAFGVKAITEDVCRRRNISPPAYRFMTTDRQQPEANLTKVHVRAQEVTQDGSVSNIFIIDDALHEGTTLKLLCEAFRGERFTNIRYFSFYDTNCLSPDLSFEDPGAYASIVERGVTKDEIWKQFGLTEDRFDEIVDAEFIDTRIVTPPNDLEKTLIKYKGFTYCFPEIHRLPYTKSAVIGVIKNHGEIYAERAKDSDVQRASQLRNEILQLANAVIQKQKSSL